MCFSAAASLGAGAVLGVIGVLAIVKTKSTPQLLFACIPLVFAVQQFVESMVWVSLKNTGLEAEQYFFTYAYVILAMIVWPVWIPLTIRLLEKNEKRKRIINLLLLAGALVSAGVFCVLLFFPVQIISANHHLSYKIDLQEKNGITMWAFRILYIAATVATPLVSSIRRVKWLGVVFGVTCLFSVIFYNGFIISVWCYFAAILSMVVLWIIWDINKNLYPT